MPYKRIGKTVYKKSGGKLISKGTSKTIDMAKKHIKALYANEPMPMKKSKNGMM